ncbi:unnamed protein product [Adineta steineri]|uniref:Uncharacterized protein n=1 Tax=Adineta steineri TaxID=433720 RepID=A0A813X165_9BILA|nr:unnamed protein product [Adineta steineri]
MSRTFDEKNHLLLSDIIIPYIYCPSFLIYDYQINNLKKSFNEYLHLCCPQAFHRIACDENSLLNGEIIEYDHKKERKIFSSESRTNESILNYLNDSCFVEDLGAFYLILASIDRVLVTSSNTRTRQRSTRRLAYICIGSGTLFWTLFHCHTLILTDIQEIAPGYSICYARAGRYVVFLDDEISGCNGY